MNDPTKLTIKEWALEEQPREKAKLYGVKPLTNAELIALIIRTGIHGANVMELAHAILNKADGNLYKLSQMEKNDFMEITGMGEVKAIQIAAIVELGRRIGKTPRTESKVISSSQDAFEYIQDMAYLDREEFWTMLLNASNKIIKIDKTFTGGYTNTTVDIRPVLKMALCNNATKIIIIHNHPTGSLSPSEHDNKLTKRIHDACALLNIDLLDHLIVGLREYGEPDYYSYSEDGQMYNL